MGQLNLDRTEFVPREAITTLIDDDRHELAFTGYFQVGDVVDIWDVDVNGCPTSLIGTRTITAIQPNVALIFDSTIDTSVAVGTPYAYAREIDDGQEAIDRLYRKAATGNTIQIVKDEPIIGQSLDDPIVGQATYDVADATYFEAGDIVDILADEGLVGTATIVSVSLNADEANNPATIVLNSSIDTSTFTSPYFQNKSLTIETLFDRVRSDIDLIDQPVENENLDDGDCKNTAFETDNLFLAGSSKVMIDGVRKKLGTAGTRAALTQGAGDAQLIYTSMILGTMGNDKVDVSVSNGVGFTVTVTGTWATGFVVDCTDNSGAATAAEIAAAINADAVAKRLVQVRYGGDGSGVVAAFVATSLAGGLDNGTGDYAELPQVFENLISQTGYKWVSFHIRPTDRNRMNKPPINSEELTMDYRMPLHNA